MTTTATEKTAGTRDASATDLQLLEVLPRQGEWSESAYLWFTDRATRLIELADGCLEVLPVPTDRHQTILFFLAKALERYFRPAGGKVLIAALRLRVAPNRFREPDIVALADISDPRRADRYWSGADLVVEIVSPDDPDRDWVRKRLDYAEAGIPEYWIVDPPTETITVLALAEGAYVEHGRFTRGDAARSARFGNLEVDVADVFDAD